MVEWPVPGVPVLFSLKGVSHAFRQAAKQAVFCVDKPKAPFKPVFAVTTTREGSEVALVHDPEAEPQIADQPPPHGHELEADSCSWWRRGSVELHLLKKFPALLAERSAIGLSFK